MICQIPQNTPQGTVGPTFIYNNSARYQAKSNSADNVTKLMMGSLKKRRHQVQTVNLPCTIFQWCCNNIDIGTTSFSNDVVPMSMLYLFGSLLFETRSIGKDQEKGATYWTYQYCWVLEHSWCTSVARNVIFTFFTLFPKPIFHEFCYLGCFLTVVAFDHSTLYFFMKTTHENYQKTRKLISTVSTSKCIYQPSWKVVTAYHGTMLCLVQSAMYWFNL